MAEQNNEPISNDQARSWTKSADVAQEIALTAGRVEALKQKSAAATENLSAPGQESAETESMSPAGTENELGRQKSAASNKPGAADQLAEAAGDLIKQQLKKKFLLWALPALGKAIFWTLIAFVVGLIIFALASVYMCVEKKGMLSTLWTTGFGTDFTELLNESFSGTCLAATTAGAGSND